MLSNVFTACIKAFKIGCDFKLFIMRKIFLFSACIVFMLLLACSGYLKEWISPEKTVAKNINLQIVEASSYKYKIYRNSSAMLNITVISVHENKSDTLVTKDYPNFKLRNLPLYSKGFNQNIYIPYVLDKKEQIIVLYTIRYTSKGSVLTIPNVKHIGKGTTNDNLLIQI